MTDKLGDRMKSFYEDRAKTYLLRRTPVIIRIDGRAFHTFTKGFEKPYNGILDSAMQNTMLYLCKNIQGCTFGYTQSDEISLVLNDYQKLTSDAWFNYSVQKVCSISASMATFAFNKNFSDILSDYVYDIIHNLVSYDEKVVSSYDKALAMGALFDSRCFNIPEEEIINYLIWRQQDATRNSINSAGQQFYSPKELYKKKPNEVQEMLFQKGINWNNYPTTFKRGCCCYKKAVSPEKSTWVLDTNMPIITECQEEFSKLFL